MKRFKATISVFLAITMLLFLSTGCLTKKNEPAETTTDTQTPETSGSDEETGSSVIPQLDVFDENGFFKGVNALDYVEMFDYEGLEIPSEIHTITEAMLQSEINYLMAAASADNQILDRAVVDGDRVNLDYVGNVNGINFDGGSTGGAGEYVNIGIDEYPDNFLEQLIGHKPGDSFDIKITFPDDYDDVTLQGKEATFATTINYIVDMEMTDDYILKNLTESYGWTTVEELKEDLRADMKLYNMQNYIKQYFTTEVSVKSVPDQMVEYQEFSMLNYYDEYALYYGVSVDDVIEYEGFATIDEMIEANHDTNVTNTTYLLVILAIAEDAGFTVSEDDVAAYIVKYQNTLDYSASLEKYGLPYIKHNVLCQKVIDYVIEHAVLL